MIGCRRRNSRDNYRVSLRNGAFYADAVNCDQLFQRNKLHIEMVSHLQHKIHILPEVNDSLQGCTPRAHIFEFIKKFGLYLLKIKEFIKDFYKIGTKLGVLSKVIIKNIILVI